MSQGSGKAIIDWGSFSIGSSGRVQFDNGGGATLNRVTGPSLSAIDGLLSATGSVYLLNPNGVVVGKTGVVNVGGRFVASTLDLTNDRFLAGGDLIFSGPSTAVVANYGKIGALGGDIVMIASTVGNSGSITAPRGSVGLLAGSQVLVRDASLDGGQFSVQVGGSASSATNAGAIAAAAVELRANGGSVYALAGNTGETISATGTAARYGRVFLIAQGGKTEVSGAVHAENADGTGGTVETSGEAVSFAGALVSTGQGGSWLIDPVDLTVDAAAASTIQNSLATTNVILQTTATTASGPGMQTPNGGGDISVSAPVSWSSANGLTLSAFRNVNINATLTSSGGGAITLASDNTGSGTGTVAFGTGVKASTSGAVDIFYNPVSFTDPATRSTQVYNTSNTGIDDYTNPYTASVTGGGALRAYMLVNSLAQLQGTAAELDGLYALSHDIDASSSATMNPINGGGFAGWQPIGTDVNGGTEFTGALNGQGHVVSGLYINRTTDQTGLFGSVGNATAITNLGVINANVTGTADATGILIGTVAGAATLANLYSTGTVSGGGNTGGLIGKGGGRISNSYSTATVSGGGSVGGLAGNESGTLTNVYATGAISSNGANIGGLVGIFGGSLKSGYATGAVSSTAGGGFVNVGGLIGSASGYVLNSYATGSVTDTGVGGQNIGGLIGFGSGNGNGNTLYQNIYATGAVSGQGNQVGGLIGYARDSFVAVNAFATGSVTSTGAGVGGLAGLSNGTFSKSYASGAVTGSGSVGGLVGANVDGTGSITDSYATGAVTGMKSSDGNVVNYIGGLVGNNSRQASIVRSYATGLVSGVGVLGGLVGGNNGVITNAIWDRDSTGQTKGVGVDLLVNGAPTTTVTNLTSVQDTTPSAADYAFAAAPYTAAGFQFGTTPGGRPASDGTPAQTWVQIDSDGSFNGQSGVATATRPILLTEYATRIVTAHQLELVSLTTAALNSSVNYNLATDVDARATATLGDVWGPAGFVPIAEFGSLGIASYSGTFDGQGHAISGLTIRPGFFPAAGLFSTLSSAATVQNLSLLGGSVGGASVAAPRTGGALEAGSLAGENDGAILNVQSTTAVSGPFAGGLVGLNAGTITTSQASGAVSGTATSAVSGGELYLGGLVGFQGSGRSSAPLVAVGQISSSSASGSVTDLDAAAGATLVYLGGLVGGNVGSVSGSFATGAVSSNVDYGTLGAVGGLVGLNGSAIASSYATGVVRGGSNVGGLVGQLGPGGGFVTNSNASGLVMGTGSNVGGLVGLSSGGNVVDAFATGAVAGTNQVGGLVGGSVVYTSMVGNMVQPSITGSAAGKTYASGAVTGMTATGGLVGENAGTITLASYAPTGAGVTGAAFTGGLVGQNDAGGSITAGASTGAVTGAQTTGGLVGLSLGSVAGSFAAGAVSGLSGTGGLVGVAVGGGAGTGITASYATGAVSGGLGTGGLVGSDTADIADSYATGAISGGGNGVAGGLVGVLGFADYNGGQFGAATVLDSYATGAVGGSSYIGGLVGRNTAQGTITGSTAGKTYASGSVTGTNFAAGGLVGENLGAISQASYAPTGAGVVAAADAGGAVGLNRVGGTLSFVFVTAPVTSTSYTGGLVGDNFGSVASSLYDGAVSGGGGVGGAVGVNEAGASVTASVGQASRATVTGTGNDVGGSAGANFGALDTFGTNGIFNGVVMGVDHVGGVAGYNAGTVSAAAMGVTVNGRDYVGGQIGLNYGTLYTAGYGTNVFGRNYVGGVAGWNDTAGYLYYGLVRTNVVATGDYVGGFAGVNKGRIAAPPQQFSGVAPASTVSGGRIVGGLVGLNQGSITSATAQAAVTGDQDVGGLVGWNDTGATISKSYATGAVTGRVGGEDATTRDDYVGGLIGVNFGSASDVYATGAVSGVQVVGGLVGTNMPGGGGVTRAYSTGPVSATLGAAGGLAGVQAGTLTSTYFQPSASGQTAGAGYTTAQASGGPTAIGAGVTCAPGASCDPNAAATYVGFDFTNTWRANADAPPTLKGVTQ